MMTKLLRVLCVVAALQVGAVAQGGWVQVAVNGPSPSARYMHAMAYDSQRGKTVLFGGQSNGTDLGDTWEWDGTAWVQVATTGPTPRAGHAMAYDSQRGRTMLFSGNGIADTWEWDGVSWALVGVAGPYGSSSFGMAYDGQRQKMVLCGSAIPGARPTWEWNGTTWVAVGTSNPGPGYAAAAVYDSYRGRVVLAGGYVGGTWEWDGTTWAQSAANEPYRAYSAMVYDSQRRQTVLYGGYTTGLFYGDTWEWNGTNWLPRSSSLPARGWHAMAYDGQRGRTVLFGGQFYTSTGGGVTPGSYVIRADTWEWTGSPGTATTFGSGCGNPTLTLSPVTTAPPTANWTAQAVLSNVPSPFAFMACGWSSTMAGPFLLPVPLDFYGMTGCWMLQSTDILGLSTTATGPGMATYALAIPNLTSVVGLSLYLQGYALAPQANPANVIVSNGLGWTIGY